MPNSLADNIQQVAVYKLMADSTSFTIQKVVNRIYFGFKINGLNITWSSTVEVQYIAESLESHKVSTVAYNIQDKWCDERNGFKKLLKNLTKAEIGRVKPVFEKVVTDTWKHLENRIQNWNKYE